MFRQTQATMSWAASDRNVRLVWLGRTCTFLAEQISEIALIWFSWQLTNSSAQVGFIIFLVRIPFWAFLWLAGVYADRFSRQRIVTGANLVGSAIGLLIPTLFLFDLLNYALLAFLAFLFALSRAVEFPALSAQIPELVPVERIAVMNTILDNTKRIGRLIAPLLSSLLLIVLAVPYLYGVVAVALIIMSACSYLLRIEAPRRPTASKSIREDLKAGWEALLADRPLFLTIICFALYNPVYAIAYWVALPRFFGIEMGGSGSWYSLAVAAFGAGALVSNLMIGALGLRNKDRGALLGFISVGLGFSLLALAPNLPIAILIVALTALGIPLMDIGVASLINERITSEHQGKVFALFRYFAEIGLAVGLLVGGYLVDQLGSRTSLAYLGIYVVPLVGIFALVIRSASKQVAQAEPTVNRTAA